MEDKLVVLKFYDTVVEAEVDLNVLQTNNIDCTLDADDTGMLYPIFSENEHRIKVYVFEKDLDLAMQLIEGYHASADDTSAGIDMETDDDFQS